MARWADLDDDGGGDDGDNDHDDDEGSVIEVGQVASNWETPRGSYSQICLTKKWSVTIKPIVLHSQFLSCNQRAK